MSKLGLRSLVLLFVAVPCAIAVGLGFARARQRSVAADEAGALSHMTSLAVVIGDLLHETQKERGASSVFLSSRGATFGDTLTAQRQLTDQARVRFVELMEDQRPLWPSHVIATLELANAALRDIESRRRQISSLDIQPRDAIAYYTDLNDKLLDSLGSIVSRTANASLRGNATAYLYFLHAKEKTGIERAQLSNVFGTDGFSPGQLATVSGLIASQAAYLSVFRSLASPDMVAFLKTQLAQPAVAEVDKMEQLALSRSSGFGIDSAVWFTTMTKKINALKAVEDAQSSAIRGEADIVARDARAAWLTALALAVLLLAVGLGATSVLFTLLVGPLGRLRECIEQVAKGDLGVTVTATGVREVNELATSMEHLVQHLRVTRGVQARPFGRSVGSRLG